MSFIFNLFNNLMKNHSIIFSWLLFIILLLLLISLLKKQNYNNLKDIKNTLKSCFSIVLIFLTIQISSLLIVGTIYIFNNFCRLSEKHSLLKSQNGIISKNKNVVYLTLEKAKFEKNDSLLFNDGSRNILLSIKDLDFLRQVKSNEQVLNKGDLYKVRLYSIQTKSNNILKSQFTIIKVLKVFE